jgi:peptidoglycan/LPS O-acetylase OafA/YrhL
MLLDALTAATRGASAKLQPAGREVGGPGLFDKLESLRGVAACLVALHHSPLLVGVNQSAFIGSAYLFVDFFFILSGFVMTHAYRDRITNGMSFRSYAGLRIARLVPLHVFAHLLFATTILGKWALYTYGMGGHDPDVHVPSFFTNLFLLQAYGVHDYLYWNRPSWSISAELGAYVVFFVMTATWDRKGRVLPPFVAAFLMYAALFSLDGDRQMDITYDFGWLRCLAGFYLGSGIFRLHRQLGSKLELRGSLQTVAEIACAISIAYCVDHVPRGDVYVIGAILSFAAAISIFSSSSKGPFGALLENRLLRKIGTWSFSIYLLHLVCFEVAGNVVHHVLGFDLEGGIGPLAIALDVVVLAVCIGLSRCTYEWIEKPFRGRAKARLAGEQAPAAQ